MSREEPKFGVGSTVYGYLGRGVVTRRDYVKDPPSRRNPEGLESWHYGVQYDNGRSETTTESCLSG